jgi:hypothetical protein
MVGTLAQPHREPWEIASSRATRPAASPNAPSTSNRPPDRSGDSGTNATTSTSITRDVAVAAQNTACQLSGCAITPASGMPTAAPTPSVELMVAVPAMTRSGGSSSLRMLMPSGSTPNAAPCSMRATSSEPNDQLTAPSSEPAVIRASA